MGSLFSAAENYFKTDGWDITPSEEHHFIKMNYRGKSGRWTCLARIREDEKQFIFYSVLDSFVPERKRMDAAEFITRANYGLFIGNFEMDMADGEIRFKTSIDVEGVEALFTPAVIKSLAFTNVSMMDRYFPGIMSVVYADVPAERAIAGIEAQT